MATITLKGNTIHTIGSLPAVGSKIPELKLVSSDLSEYSLTSIKGKKAVLNIFPSLDTSVCAASVRKFNAEASSLENTVVLCISADLPFAQNRFCGTEDLKNVVTLSVFRNPEVGEKLGVTITDGGLKGLLSRSVIVIDKDGTVRYTEQVPEIAQEPDYAKALEAVKKA